MAQATTRPNVPVFVSSTFTDMQAYRRKIRDALAQLETVVRGMEYFGVCVQPVSATPLVVYRLAFGSPRSFADVD